MKMDLAPATKKSCIKLPSALALFAWGMPLLWLVSATKVTIERHFPTGGEVWVMPHHFEDFICYWFRIRLLHTVAFFEAPDTKLFGSGWGYPAPPIFIYRFFYLFDPLRVERPYRGFVVMISVGLSIAGWFAYQLYKALQNRGLCRMPALCLVSSAFLLSWPLLFALQRGNIELLLWLPLVLAAYAYARARWLLAALLIGFVASFKLYPIILLALLLRRKRFGEILAGMATAIAMTVVSLWYMGPSVRTAWKHIGLGVSGFIQGHGAKINWATEGYNHSLFHLFKVNIFAHAELLASIIPEYMLIIGIVMTLIFFVKVIRMPSLNQLMVLTISMIFLPPTSYDYTLQVLYIPWAWLTLIAVSRARRGQRVAGMLPAMVLFALVLGPELFLTSGGYIRSGTLKAVCLAALLVIASVFPFEDPDLLALSYGESAESSV